MNYNNIGVVILAAGKGSRMKSDTAKVLHKIAKKSMVIHVLEQAMGICPGSVHVVVGHQAERVIEEINRSHEVNYAYQKELLGTGDAVKAAIPGLGTRITDVLVLCGDVPLIKQETLLTIVDAHIKTQSAVTVLATELKNPTGYGRIVFDDMGNLMCIREEADASDAEKRIKLVNAGIYCFDKRILSSALNEISPENSQREYYLTDVIEISQKKKEKITVVITKNSHQVIGVNTLEELERAELTIQGQKNELP